MYSAVNRFCIKLTGVLALGLFTISGHAIAQMKGSTWLESQTHSSNNSSIGGMVTARGVALNADADCGNASLDITLTAVGASREFGLATTPAGVTLTEFEGPTGLGNFDGTYVDFRIGLDVVVPPITYIGSYAYIGNTPPEPETTGEFFVLYNCHTREVLQSCYGPFGSCPQTAQQAGASDLLSEAFTEVSFPPSGWTVKNIDGQLEQWSRLETFALTPGSATHAWNSSVAQEGWLVTPPLSITGGARATLSFLDGGQWMDRYGYSGVMVSTGSCDPVDGDFVELAEIDDTPGLGANMVWRQTSVNLDLSAYSSETICIAFLYEGLDAHRWLIDSVIVSELITDEIFIDSFETMIN